MALSKEYVDYIVNGRDSLITGLKEFYKYSILPAESFFHAALVNGKFCGTKINNNLNFNNWNHDFGCQCEVKARVVDWCGCSPQNFRELHMPLLDMLENKTYFIRKFEPLVTQVGCSFERMKICSSVCLSRFFTRYF